MKFMKTFPIEEVKKFPCNGLLKVLLDNYCMKPEIQYLKEFSPYWFLAEETKKIPQMQEGRQKYFIEFCDCLMPFYAYFGYKYGLRDYFLQHEESVNEASKMIILRYDGGEKKYNTGHLLQLALKFFKGE